MPKKSTAPETVPTAVRPRIAEPLGVRWDNDTWVFVTERAQQDLDALRVKNDDPKLNEVETAVLRGRIRELKRLLALPKRVEEDRAAALAQREAPSLDDD